MLTAERRNEIENAIEQDCLDSSDYCPHCQNLLDLLNEVDRLEEINKSIHHEMHMLMKMGKADREKIKKLQDENDALILATHNVEQITGAIQRAMGDT